MAGGFAYGYVWVGGKGWPPGHRGRVVAGVLLCTGLMAQAGAAHGCG